jgi:sarcosine oxidase subunit beta
MGGRLEVLILGAGILGCALAWRLAARDIYRGESILVVDPNPAASQATSCAAALLSLARPAARAHWIPLVQSTQTMAETLARTGYCAPLHRIGAVHLADSAYARKALSDYESEATRHGVRCERIAPRDCAEQLPWLEMGRFAEALWFPEESYTDPFLLASAYATAAKALGVRFCLGRPASLLAKGTLVAVNIDEAELAPNSVWVAAGAWSSAVLSPLGASAPQGAVRSQYWITHQTPLATDAMPMVSAVDLKLYARPEMGAILFGLREARGIAVTSMQLPKDLAGFVFDAEDVAGYATLGACADLLQAYAPGLMRTGLRHHIAGPSCYTPDGDFLVGRVAGWDNLKLLSGCNGAGIAVSAGLADVAADYESGADDTSHAYSPTRFGSFDPDASEFIASCISARSGKTGA